MNYLVSVLKSSRRGTPAACVYCFLTSVSKLFVDCGVVPLEVSKAAVEEYTSYVVEKRRQRVDSDRVASTITNMMNFLFGNFASQSGHLVLRVIKLCCIVIASARNDFPRVSLDLSGCVLEQEDFDSCVRSGQTYVMSSDIRIKHFSRLQFWMREAIGDTCVFSVAMNEHQPVQ